MAMRHSINTCVFAIITLTPCIEGETRGNSKNGEQCIAEHAEFSQAGTTGVPCRHQDQMRAGILLQVGKNTAVSSNVAVSEQLDSPEDHWDWLKEDGHWDWLEEEEPKEKLHTGEPLGGIKDILQDTITEALKPLKAQVVGMSENLTKMQGNVESFHYNATIKAKLQEALDPATKRLSDMDEKIDQTHASQQEVKKDVQGAAIDLGKLDALGVAVEKLPTSDVLQDVNQAITGSVQGSEHAAAQALYKVHSKITENGKSLQHLYWDLHGHS